LLEKGFLGDLESDMDLIVRRNIIRSQGWWISRVGPFEENFRKATKKFLDGFSIKKAIKFNNREIS